MSLQSVPDPKPTIVLGDTNIHVLVQLQDLLRTMFDQYEVIPVVGGADVLALLQLRPVKLVITEIGLDYGRDGYDFVRQMKKVSPHTRVLVHTAYVTPDLAHNVYKAGADYYLPKPAPLSDIEFVVKDAMSRSSVTTDESGPVVVALAGALIETTRWSPETAHAAARYLYLNALQDYRAASAPYGDTHSGLMFWIEQRVAKGHPGWIKNPEQ